MDDESTKMPLNLDDLNVCFFFAVKPLAKTSRPPHICSTCNKEFKNSYNLRRHQSVHTGIRMKDRSTREKEGGAKGARVEKQMIPLSLLQLTLPTQPPPPSSTTPSATAVDTIPQPSLHTDQESQPISVSITQATVTMAAAALPVQAAIVEVGSVEQVEQVGNLHVSIHL